jgi:lipid II:glycine glycyltransferase (peptidoglycan interpeptide bridge formation enzyme)
VLYRRLGAGFSFAYVPWGPEASCAGGEPSAALAALAAELRRQLPPSTVFIRFDPPWYTTENSASRIPPPFHRAASDVQPPDSVLVDLTAGEETIRGRMKPKWRYNIGLAERNGVVVRCAGASSPELPAALESYYRIYEETAERDGIAIHGIDYYRTLFELAAEPSPDSVQLRLYLASHEGEDLAGVVTLFRRREAVYLYGASRSHKRSLMAPYALQWRAMRDAKAALCEYYDLFGIPPHPPDRDPNHPMAGLYRFKTGFGGTIIHRPGSWDYGCRPFLKAAFFAAEGLRKKVWTLKKLLKRKKR